MNRTQRTRRRCAAILAALAAATTWAGGAPAAFAAPVPPPGTSHAGSGPAAPAHAGTLGGIHGWQAILVAIGPVLAGAVLAVLYDRARAARQERVTAHVTRA
jgi:hypothetical protein